MVGIGISFRCFRHGRGLVVGQERLGHGSQAFPDRQVENTLGSSAESCTCMGERSAGMVTLKLESVPGSPCRAASLSPRNSCVTMRTVWLPYAASHCSIAEHEMTHV